MRRRVILFSFLLALIAGSAIWLVISGDAELAAVDGRTPIIADRGIVFLEANLTEYIYGQDGPALLVRDPDQAGLTTANLQPGDLVLEVDGERPDATNWPHLLEKASAGATLKVVRHRTPTAQIVRYTNLTLDEADPRQLLEMALDSEGRQDWRQAAAVRLSTEHPRLFIELVYRLFRRGNKEADLAFLVDLALQLDSLGGSWFAMWGAWRLDWRSAGEHLAAKMEAADQGAATATTQKLAELGWLTHHGAMENWLTTNAASDDLLVALFATGALAHFDTALSRQALCRSGGDKRGVVRESAAKSLVINMHYDREQAKQLCEEWLDEEDVLRFQKLVINASGQDLPKPDVENLIRNYIRRDKNIVGTFLFPGFDKVQKTALAHSFSEVIKQNPRFGFDLFFCGDGLRGPQDYEIKFTKRELNLYPMSATMADGLIGADPEALYGAMAEISAVSCLKLIGAGHNRVLRSVFAARQLAVLVAGEGNVQFGSGDAELAIVEDMLNNAGIAN
jgi:hypothetical protein